MKKNTNLVGEAKGAITQPRSGNFNLFKGGGGRFLKVRLNLNSRLDTGNEIDNNKDSDSRHSLRAGALLKGPHYGFTPGRFAPKRQEDSGGMIPTIFKQKLKKKSGEPYLIREIKGRPVAKPYFVPKTIMSDVGDIQYFPA